MTPEETVKLRGFFLKALGVALVIAALIVGVIFWQMPKEPIVGGDFTLNAQGQEWQFSKNAKDLNLLYIGYTNCPDVCPLTLSHAGAAFDQLSPEELGKVQLIFVSVDVEHETPKEVMEFAHHFNKNFIGLGGKKEDIDKMLSLFHASYIMEKDPGSFLGYSIAHTDRLFYLDNKGRVIDEIQNPRSEDLILKKIKENL